MTVATELEDAQVRLDASCVFDVHAAGKTHLNRFDLKPAWVAMFGFKPARATIARVFGDGEGRLLDKSGFIELVVSHGVHKRHDAHIRSIFNALDVHGRGFLTPADTLQAIQTVAPHLARQPGFVDRLFASCAFIVSPPSPQKNLGGTNNQDSTNTASTTIAYNHSHHDKGNNMGTFQRISYRDFYTLMTFSQH